MIDILVTMKIKLLESKLKAMIAENHKNVIKTFYIIKDKGYYNLESSVDFETVHKVKILEHKDDYYSVLINKALEISKKQGYIGTYVNDFVSIRISGAWLSFDSGTNISLILNSVEKSIRRYLNRLNKSEKYLVKYMGYCLGQKPVKNGVQWN